MFYAIKGKLRYLIIISAFFTFHANSSFAWCSLDPAYYVPTVVQVRDLSGPIADSFAYIDILVMTDIEGTGSTLGDEITIINRELQGSYGTFFTPDSAGRLVQVDFSNLGDYLWLFFSGAHLCLNSHAQIQIASGFGGGGGSFNF